MDTLGRTTLELRAINMVDEQRDRDILVTYDLPFLAAFRKPAAIFGLVISLFVGYYALGLVDTSIGRSTVLVKEKL
jgi:oligosaccharyltransferase complex subunit alpha (ribophorin I)